MEISPVKAVLIHADSRKKVKQMDDSATTQERIKITCDSQEGRIIRQHFGCAKSMVSRNKFSAVRSP